MTGVDGHVAPGFAAVREAMAATSADDPSWAAQFCGYVDGEPVVDLWCGPELGGTALLGLFSATKGVSGVCLALLVERGQLDLDAPVATYWPEFAANGKAGVTVRIALSHQAGLVGVEPQLTLAELLDHPALAARLAATVPAWAPGAAHGYHALTIGALLDELVRRIDGRTVADFFRQEIGDPRGIDFWIAAPPDQLHRVRDVLPAEPAPDVPPADGLAGLAFNAAAQHPFDPLPANVPAVRAAGVAAIGGVGSARGLARLYAGCIAAVDGHPPLLSPATVAAVGQLQAVGTDLVLGIPSRFAVVFQKPDDRLRYGSHLAFGHDGAGGAIGVADPWHRLAYGYVVHRMPTPGGADPRGLHLAQVLRDCLPPSPTR